jgi:FixJ family two-component response regulator
VTIAATGNNARRGEQVPVQPASQIVSVVDDDESVCKALRRLLRSFGLKVETFATAEEFLARASSDSPAFLIVDVRMPGMSGLELQQHLNATGRKLPIVFITAHEDQQARHAALAAGAVDFLIKPFDEQVLLRAVTNALGRENEEEAIP